MYVSFPCFLMQTYDQMYSLICHLPYTKGYVHIGLRALVAPVCLDLWGQGDEGGRGDHHIPESSATETFWAQKAWEGVRELELWWRGGGGLP